MAWKAFIDQSMYRGRLKVAIGRKEYDGAFSVIKPAVLEMVGPGMLAPDEPFMDGPSDDVRQFLSAIVDAAWDIGIRPTDYGKRTDEQSRHLNDMRAIVSKLADVPLP